MSSSVVDQFDTEIRIASMPCQCDPPSQQTRSSCTSRNASRVAASASPVGRHDADEHLIQHDVVQDLNRRLLPKTIGEAPRQAAAAIDQVGDAAPPEGPQRGVDGEPARPAR